MDINVILYIISLVSCLLVFFTYKYLSELETSCACVKENEGYEKTVNHLKIFELITLIAPIVMGLIFPIKQIYFVAGIFFIFLDIFFLKNAFDFMKIPKKCPCAKKKIRYFIYWQVFSILMVFLLLFVGLVGVGLKMKYKKSI